MSIILPRRQFLTGLFATPAIVMASSLMPIKPVSAGIFKLESFSEIPTFDSWCYVKEVGGNFAWMMESQVNRFASPLEIIENFKTKPVGTTIKERTQFEATLMKYRPGRVITDIPYHYLK